MLVVYTAVVWVITAWGTVFIMPGVWGYWLAIFMAGARLHRVSGGSFIVLVGEWVMLLAGAGVTDHNWKAIIMAVACVQVMAVAWVQVMAVFWVHWLAISMAGARLHCNNGIFLIIKG